MLARKAISKHTAKNVYNFFINKSTVNVTKHPEFSDL